MFGRCGLITQSVLTNKNATDASIQSVLPYNTNEHSSCQHTVRICVGCTHKTLRSVQVVCLSLDYRGTHNYTKTLLPSIDVDECKRQLHNCHTQAACANTIGGFKCVCRKGFIGSGTTCLPVLAVSQSPCGTFLL